MIDVTPPKPMEQLPLAPPRLITRGMMILAALLAFLIFGLLQQSAEILDTELPWWAWLAPALLPAILLGLRRLSLPRSPRVIFFEKDHLRLPKSRNSWRYRDLPYDEIRTIVPLVSRGEPALVIDGGQKTQIYVASDFPHPELWRVFWSQILDRIQRRPRAFERLREMQALAELSQETTAVQPRFSKYLLWLLIAVFAGQYFLGHPVQVLESLYWGANSSLLVFDHGQWWRVITANLLHGNTVHILVNGFALYFLGTYSERLLGEVRTVVLVLATALAGATASTIAGQALFSVGMSTGLFGLLGAYFAVQLRYGASLPPPYRQSRMWWAVILGLNVALSVFVPVIDKWAHFGGFAAGMALAWAMTAPHRGPFLPRPPVSRLTTLFAGLLVAIFLVGSAFAVTYGLGDRQADEILMARHIEESSPELSPTMVISTAAEWSRHDRPREVSEALFNALVAALPRVDDPYGERVGFAALFRLSLELGDDFTDRAISVLEEVAELRDDPGLIEEFLRPQQ